MKDKDKFENQIEKIIEGLNISTQEMIKFKKAKNSPIVVSRNGEILLLNPHEIQLTDSKEDY